MRRLMLVLVFLFTLASTSFAQENSPASASQTAYAQMISPVVQVSAVSSPNWVRGSGTFISSNGKYFILTARHVVCDMEEFKNAQNFNKDELWSDHYKPVLVTFLNR